MIDISSVLDHAVALGGGRLRALRANFHTLHLIIEAYSEFNNSGSSWVAVQSMSKHNHQRSDLLHACARIVFDHHSRRFHNNFAAALNGQTQHKLSHLIIEALLSKTEPGG